MNKRIMTLGLVISTSFLAGFSWSMEVGQSPAHIARIAEEEIVVQRYFFEAAVNKSEKIRSVAKGVAYVAAAAALASAGYRLFMTSAPILPNAKALTQEKSYELFLDLYRQVRPPLFSWDWYKSILMNPITVLEMTFLGLKSGYTFLSHKLYAPNVQWILEHKTRLGLLETAGIDANEHFEFEPGLLFKELERSAITLDSGARPRSLLPIDEPYEREHLLAAMNDLVEDFTKLFGFLDYLIDQSDDEALQMNIGKGTVYLKQCITSFSEALEGRLNREINDPYMPLVQEFIAQVKQCILRFV